MLFPWYTKYPYQNDEVLNLDWVLKTIENLVKEVANFVTLNTIKYADPIQWNITTQYEKNTLVIDPISGTAYLSTKPVPAGVGLSNTDYWTVVFTMDIMSANKNITLRDDANNPLATFESAKGDWLLSQGNLYIVLRQIDIGEAYVVDYNIERRTVEDFLKEYITALKNYVDTLLGDLDDLETTNKTNLVAAINEVLSTISNIIGDLDELDTTDKTNLVAAINEVLSTISNITGDLDDLDTTDKTNLVAAINELMSDKLSNANIYNIVDYGALGDGLTDCSDAIDAAIVDATTNGGVVYIPAGNYNITRTINVAFNKPFSIMGVGDSSVLIHSTNNTIFNFTNRANLMTVKDLRITSTTIAKTTAAAFYFTLGCYRIIFENVRYDLDNESDPDMHFPYSFFNCPDTVNTDTVAFINCYMEHIDGPAYKVGTGSSIWITGGRIVGTGYDLGRPNSVGLKCNGGMGGVYISSVDFIKLRIGVQISNLINDSNREFFIVNTTFDGDDLGFYITDGDAGTYIEITGCWICTSNDIGIYSAAGAKPHVKISNSTISLIGLSAADPTNSIGLNINGGTWSVDNCRFWHDGGKALYVNLSGVGDYGVFKNNILHDNYKDAEFTGYVTFSDNLLVDNSGITRYDNNSIVEHNQGQTPVTTPTLPAAGVGIVNDTGRHVLISLTGTNVQGMYLNNVLQIANAGSIIAAPKDAISLAYTGTDLVWKWFDL